jgi:hypothetical protein
MNAQVKSKSMPQVTVQPISEMVDRFVDLQNQLSFVDSLIKERDSLRKQLAVHADSISDGAVKLTGDTCYVSFTKAPAMRSIENIGGFLEAVGLDKFLTAVKISTTVADKLLNETQKAELFEVSVGARRVKDTGELMQAVAPRQGAELFNFLAGLSNPTK